MQKLKSNIEKLLSDRKARRYIGFALAMLLLQIPYIYNMGSQPLFKSHRNLSAQQPRCSNNIIEPLETNFLRHGNKNRILLLENNINEDTFSDKLNCTLEEIGVQNMTVFYKNYSLEKQKDDLMGHFAKIVKKSIDSLFHIDQTHSKKFWVFVNYPREELTKYLNNIQNDDVLVIQKQSQNRSLKLFGNWTIINTNRDQFVQQHKQHIIDASKEEKQNISSTEKVLENNKSITQGLQLTNETKEKLDKNKSVNISQVEQNKNKQTNQTNITENTYKEVKTHENKSNQNVSEQSTPEKQNSDQEKPINDTNKKIEVEIPKNSEQVSKPTPPDPNPKNPTPTPSKQEPSSPKPSPPPHPSSNSSPPPKKSPPPPPQSPKNKAHPSKNPQGHQGQHQGHHHQGHQGNHKNQGHQGNQGYQKNQKHQGKQNKNGGKAKGGYV